MILIKQFFWKTLYSQIFFTRQLRNFVFLLKTQFRNDKPLQQHHDITMPTAKTSRLRS